MKHLKLKNTYLCQLLLYSPVIFAILASACSIFLIGPDDEVTLPFIILLIAPMVLILIFLIKNFAFYMLADGVLSFIRAWQKSRQYFQSDINGNDILTAENKIRKRTAFFGKAYECVEKYISPSLIRYTRKPPSSIHYSKVDKYFFLYTADHLDEDLYRNILSSSKANIKRLYKPFKPTVFTSKDQKNAPVAKCTAVVILCNSVTDEVIKKASKCTQNKFYGCILPCVINVNKGLYYFDSRNEIYEAGLLAKPEKNYTVSMIKKYVFSGKLPLKNNDKMLRFDSEIDIETPFFEFVKKVKSDFKESDKESKEFADTLSEKEVKTDEDLIYCKLNGKTATFSLFADEENERNVEIILMNEYDFPKKSKISIKEMNEIKKLINTHLSSDGYNVTFVSDLLPKSYRK